MSIVNSQAHSPTARSTEVRNSQAHTHSQSLEALVRIALFNRELAPGVAKQINAYRSEELNEYKKRLLAILDDAIADQCIIVIPTSDQPTLQPIPQPATVRTTPFVLCHSIPSL